MACLLAMYKIKRLRSVFKLKIMHEKWWNFFDEYVFLRESLNELPADFSVLFFWIWNALWRVFRYEKNRQFELDTILLITAQSGLYMYFMFSLIAGYLTLEETKPKGSRHTVIFKSICGIVQSTVQTLFIVDAWWRRCTTSQVSLSCISYTDGSVYMTRIVLLLS